MLLVLVACALPPVPDTFVPVDDDLGPAWAWSADPSVVVAVGDDPDGLYAPGLYVRRGEDLAARFAAAPSLRDATWVPPLLATAHAPARLEDEPGLALALEGSAAPGCEEGLVARVTPIHTGDALEIEVALTGVPTFAAAAEGLARVDGDAFDLGRLDASGVYVEDVSAIETPDFTFTATSPIPRLQLRAVSGYVAIDLDAACARERDWVGEGVLAFTL